MTRTLESIATEVGTELLDMPLEEAKKFGKAFGAWTPGLNFKRKGTGDPKNAGIPTKTPKVKIVMIRKDPSSGKSPAEIGTNLRKQMTIRGKGEKSDYSAGLMSRRNKAKTQFGHGDKISFESHTRAEHKKLRDHHLSLAQAAKKKDGTPDRVRNREYALHMSLAKSHDAAQKLTYKPKEKVTSSEHVPNTMKTVIGNVELSHRMTPLTKDVPQMVGLKGKAFKDHTADQHRMAADFHAYHGREKSELGHAHKVMARHHIDAERAHKDKPDSTPPSSRPDLPAERITFRYAPYKQSVATSPIQVQVKGKKIPARDTKSKLATEEVASKYINPMMLNTGHPMHKAGMDAANRAASATKIPQKDFERYTPAEHATLAKAHSSASGENAGIAMGVGLPKEFDSARFAKGNLKMARAHRLLAKAHEQASRSENLPPEDEPKKKRSKDPTEPLARKK